jgi:hypothetical protein
LLVRSDTKQTFVLYAPSALERDKWIKEVNACILALPPIVAEDKKASAGKETKDAKEKKKDRFKLNRLLSAKGSQNDLTMKSKSSKEIGSIVQSIESNDPTFTKLTLNKVFIKQKGTSLHHHLLT